MWWKIWYKDGEVEGTTFQEWINAPEENVVYTYELFYVEDGIPYGRLNSGADWYWMMPDGNIYNNGYSGDEIDHWVSVELPSGAIAKKGKWVSEERLAQVQEEVNNIIMKRYE